MKRDEQLKFCTICTHRQMDMQQGIICNLTNAKADFEEKCETFEADQKAIEKELMTQREKTAAEVGDLEENPNMRGTNWFLIIGVFSLANILFEFTGFRLVVGLGITSILSGGFGIIGIAVSILISIFYIVLAVVTNKKECEWLYRLGFYSYLTDTILMMVVGLISMDFLIDNIFHIAILITTYVSHSFFSKSIRDKAKLEKWSAWRIATTTIVSLLIAFSLIFSLLIVLS